MLKDIKDLYLEKEKYLGKEVIICGWIKNHRKQKEFGFIDFYDGTYFKSLQVIYDDKLSNFEEISKFRIGSSIKVIGNLILSPKLGQEFEVVARDVILIGDSNTDYPIQPKQHSREYLREIAYLRPRTNLYQAVFRVRSVASFAIHSYFNERGYIYFHAPIITGSDCEGAGEMFNISTLDPLHLPLDENKNIDYKKDFFGKKASLTVSGQLQAETFAHAFKKVYTFGPTFRAENSNTRTHASEFWMIEPEVAFCDLEGIMDLEEDMLRYIIKYVLTNCQLEIEFLDKYIEVGLIQKLQMVLDKKPVRITHKEAVKILLDSKKEFENKPAYKEDLATEHEKFLTGEYFSAPVFIKDWPKDIKAFYMRMNDDNETVAAVDLLVPGAGELMGGSQREERYDKLVERMDLMHIDKEELYWYLNLRKYGTCVHSGFGMGFDRLVIYLTGVENIRDVIPYARTPKNLEF